VDVRGGAPGTRETGVFTPGNLVSEIHAVVFSGGSAFGLAASNGVMSWLARRGVGFAIGNARVPIVAGAILFDLGVGESGAYPDEASGEAACEAAGDGAIPTGQVGAGGGATVGKLLGVARASRGGVGAASIALPGGERVAALAAVNAFGDVVDPETGRRIAGAQGKATTGSQPGALLEEKLQASPHAGANTTLSASRPTSRSAGAGRRRGRRDRPRGPRHWPSAEASPRALPTGRRTVPRAPRRAAATEMPRS
jgi:L-aminopeptidase/D-esterase-like protein